jgi:hypothetical protein
MSTTRRYKRRKKSAVELTSLLDLLFVMIFVSLLQQKNIPTPTKVKPKKGKVTKIKIPIAVKKKIAPKTVAKVAKASSFSLQATLGFYSGASVTSSPLGSFNMVGRFDEKTKKFRLAGVSWIKRPKDFAMIPVAGTLDTSGQVMNAKLGHPLCKAFKLIKTISGGANPISGTWEGRYDCTQGLTGVSITIK